MENKEILFLNPCLKDVVWGGKKLRDEFHYEGAGDSTGECWGISARPNGDDTVKNGEFAGMKLSELYKTHRELFGNIQAEEFPLLVKIINADADLSIQVHPDDAYAREHEGCPYGKTECWYVMDCPEDASLVIGHHAKTREELARMIHEDRYEELVRQIILRPPDKVQALRPVLLEDTNTFPVIEFFFLLTLFSHLITSRDINYYSAELIRAQYRDSVFTQTLEHLLGRMPVTVVANRDDRCFGRGLLQKLRACGILRAVMRDDEKVSILKLMLTHKLALNAHLNIARHQHIVIAYAYG